MKTSAPRDESLAAEGRGVSRRRILLAGTALVTAAGAAAMWAQARKKTSMLPEGLDLRKIKALAGGFYMVDGWVLTEADLRALGVEAPPVTPAY